ncbi:MAG TPA: hypothetical protein VFM18_22995 [Methanosarcina sp.]|nr:hypothetical protein [Methanosarcina sp.]
MTQPTKMTKQRLVNAITAKLSQPPTSGTTNLNKNIVDNKTRYVMRVHKLQRNDEYSVRLVARTRNPSTNEDVDKKDASWELIQEIMDFCYITFGVPDDLSGILQGRHPEKIYFGFSISQLKLTNSVPSNSFDEVLENLETEIGSLILYLNEINLTMFKLRFQGQLEFEEGY